MKIDEDGIIFAKDTHGEIIPVGINSDLAIKNETDPRKCFLIGQLHTEYYLDTIITGYFSLENYKREILQKFLKSKNLSFNDKIELMKSLKDKAGKEIVSKEIINSLIVIAEIRNAFQHHLIKEDAIKSLSNNRRKITLKNSNKKLNQYKNSIELMNDFKEFFNLLYPKLIAIWIKTSLSKEDQEKFLKSLTKK